MHSNEFDLLLSFSVIKQEEAASGGGVIKDLSIEVKGDHVSKISLLNKLLF